MPNWHQNNIPAARQRDGRRSKAVYGRNCGMHRLKSGLKLPGFSANN
jgi:hypothetical protein